HLWLTIAPGSWRAPRQGCADLDAPIPSSVHPECRQPSLECHHLHYPTTPCECPLRKNKPPPARAGRTRTEMPDVRPGTRPSSTIYHYSRLATPSDRARPWRPRRRPRCSFQFCDGCPPPSPLHRNPVPSLLA